MQTVLIVLLVLLALYLVFIAFPAIVMTVMTFTPKKTFYTELSDLKDTYYHRYYDRLQQSSAFFGGMQAEKLTVRGYDGTPLNCDYYNNNHAERVAILFHGYRATPEVNCMPQAEFLYAQGYSIALVYQRGHNRQAGRRIGLGTIERHDVLTWCEYFRTETAHRQALLYGVSMGSTALALASDALPVDFAKGIVLDCGFVSAYNQIKKECKARHLPTKLLEPYIFLTAKLLLHEDIRDTVCTHLSRCKIPKLFLHGTADSTVDRRDAELAYAAAAEPKTLVLTQGAEHTFSYLENTATVQTHLISMTEQMKGDSL